MYRRHPVYILPVALVKPVDYFAMSQAFENKLTYRVYTMELGMRVVLLHFNVALFDGNGS